MNNFLILLQRYYLWIIAGFLLLVGFMLQEVLVKISTELHYSDVVDAIHSVSGANILWAILATIVSYISLTGYDHSSLRYVGAKVPFGVVTKTSFIAYSLGNVVGLGALTGGAVRMRMYGAAGVEASRIARAVIFNAIAFGMTTTIVGAVAILFNIDQIAPVVNLPESLLFAISVLIVVFFLLFIFLCAFCRAFSFRGFELEFPSVSITIRQLLFSVIDITASAAVIWFLLPESDIEFVSFVAIFSIAMVFGIISHVPGGLGVFETVILASLNGHVPMDGVASALVLYRLIYYMLPLIMAMILLIAVEVQRGTMDPVKKALVMLSPFFLTAFTFFVGVNTLLIGVIPMSDDLTEMAALHVPLSLFEAAHFLNSIVGLALLVVARGMWLRLDAAWWSGLILSVISLILYLPKGFDFSETFSLFILIVGLIFSRTQFTRRASIFALALSKGWLISILMVVVSLVSLLFFAYRDIEYTHELWWQFEFDAHAPRSMRMLVAVALLTFILALWQLFKPSPPKLARPNQNELNNIASIVDNQEMSDARLVFMGDKYIVVSDSNRAFLMFGRIGRAWVVLGDPIGAQEEFSDLVWRFIELARNSGGYASFYKVKPEYLPLYLDAGMRILKLGEEAFVSLTNFSLSGSKRSKLRTSVNRSEREGLRFDVILKENVPEILPIIKNISDIWLSEHNTAEKAFSLGAFDPDYILRAPVAVIYKGDEIIAFATLMVTAMKAEASIDLMRHIADVPNGTMDYLFVKLMLYFQDQGYQRFNLGMAPLSGLTSHPFGSRWQRLGHALFNHGEHFYNFKGLRSFKEKFDPEWEPRYLASPGGMTHLIVLANITMLISGNFKRLITK